MTDGWLKFSIESVLTKLIVNIRTQYQALAAVVSTVSQNRRLSKKVEDDIKYLIKYIIIEIFKQ